MTKIYKKESLYVKKIEELLTEKGAYYENIHGGSMFQSAGIPDIIVCYKGFFIGLEAKVNYNKPSELQKAKIDIIRQAGGFGAIVWSVLDPVESIIRVIDAYHNGMITKEELDTFRIKYSTRVDSLGTKPDIVI